ncbi:glucans biosynthesis glucosyltransferase MdoH [Aristophania vespae]|uniref:Glucans biosynthesis glucosyltransferase H n=1 Tax=Aristophania vespae TaxID=2697033 RepID=A0A6P1NK12_9PROT|nr:glucans biosynthesis glucosyltransferase MdoH [Aristophania vespae]QHI95201.1 glucans biosynthesis glucosyltransferase MdoH [Aristophania vespae]UMM64428.1 Glucans biosynthesis glucosyltransferase H [Aristophania vespae]
MVETSTSKASERQDQSIFLSRRMSKRRISIGGVTANPKETKSIIGLANLKSLVPTTYHRSVSFRRSLNVVISGTLALLSTAICYESIAGIFSIPVVIDIFCVIFFILSYHATTSLSKLILGNLCYLLVDRKTKDPAIAERLNPGTLVAVLYPVYNEDPSRIIGNILATWEQLKRIDGAAAHYEFFVLSDSRTILKRVCEEKAIMEARKIAPDLRITYRWRSINSHAKLGNVMDFLRRYSADFKYMLVMDADSLMSGEAVHTLSLISEANDKIGIVQTNPIPIMRTSIFGRMLQFACEIYGAPFFKAIKHYHLSDAFYIGHNAIIRLEPFVKHCILPKLEGEPPWGGKPLSHDLVEAALMAKHGYDVWFIPEIDGSYEEIPSNIISFLIRERRWMQGNIQNIRVALGFGLKHIHRDLLMSGFMAYFSSIFWSLFILIMTVMRLGFHSGHEIHEPNSGMVFGTSKLLIYSLVLLFLPRVIGIIYCFITKAYKHYGGAVSVIFSCIIDTIFSSLFAPIVMIFVVRFFLMYIKSMPVKWGTQDRDDDALPWSMCIKSFSIPIACGVALLFMNMPVTINDILYDPDLFEHMIPPLSLESQFLWSCPMVFALIMSAVTGRVSSRSMTDFFNKKLFVTKEEFLRPEIITLMTKYTSLMEDKLSCLNSDDEAIAYAYHDAEFFNHHMHYTFNRQSRLSDHLDKIEKKNEIFIAAFYNRADYKMLFTRFRDSFDNKLEDSKVA